MADDIVLSTNIGTGAKVKTDDDGTAHWQYVKLAFGPNNTQTIVTASVGMPVELLASTASIGKLASNSGVDIGDVTLNAGTAEIGKLAAGSAVIGEVTIGAATGAAGDLAKAEDAVHGSGDIGVMSLAVRNDTLAALAGTDGDYAPFQVNATGALYIQEGSALDVSGATLTVNAHAVTNAGTFVVQEDGAALTALQVIDNIVHVDDAAFTLGTSSGVMMMGFAGTQSVNANDAAALACDTDGALHISDGGNSITIDGTVTANPASGTIDTVTTVGTVTNISAGTNLIGDVGLSGARTSGGTTIFRSIDLDEGSLEVVKASAGQVYWLHVMNLSTGVRFVKIYNATSGTIGTGTPVLTFPVPTLATTNGAGFTLAIPNGIAFSTGISIGASTAVADNDTGAPGANEVVVNLGFA